MRIAITLFILICKIPLNVFGQIIPVGLSKDSITILELNSPADNQSFYLYKPQTYNGSLSPIWFVIHGTGGTGAGTINNLSDIADRQGALMVGLTMDGIGTTMISQTSLVHNYDTVDNCNYRLAGSIIMNKVYQYICDRESRAAIPVYLSGFSAGGQFVSRYMLIRQAYPDSLPLKMSLSMSPIGYTLPTDSFLGVAQPWVCGLIMPTSSLIWCKNAFDLYSWRCNEHVVQYYDENYAVCVGDQDLASQINGGCYDITGISRLDRARTFYAFCDSNAINRGTTLNWQYAEIPGAGHDENSLFNTKYLPTDSFTIAENILFNTPYHTVNHTAPVASFIADTTVISANDTVFFTNLSSNCSAFTWDFGDSTSSNAANPFHIYSNPGIYPVELRGYSIDGCESWCMKWHYIIVTSGVGFQELNTNNLKIYPNPSGGDMFIEGLEANFRKYAIYNFEGKLIETESLNHIYETEIDISSQPAGVYLISLIQESGKSIGIKLIKL